MSTKFNCIVDRCNMTCITEDEKYNVLKVTHGESTHYELDTVTPSSAIAIKRALEMKDAGTSTTVVFRHRTKFVAIVNM